MEELREEPAAKAASSNPKPARPQAGEKSKFDLQEFIGSERVVRFLYYLCGGVFITLIFRKLQFSTQSICCGDFDGYYHIRWSRLLWENFRSGHILPPDFTWLPLTTLDQQNYVDHHYLFHLMQIPFTWFFALPTAAKLSALLFASLAVFACYWLVMRHRLDYPLLWLLALVGCHKTAVQEPALQTVRGGVVERVRQETPERYAAIIAPVTQVDLAFQAAGVIDSVQQIRGADGRTRDVQAGDFVGRGAALAVVRSEREGVLLSETNSKAKRRCSNNSKKRLTGKAPR